MQGFFHCVWLLGMSFAKKQTKKTALTQEKMTTVHQKKKKINK